LNRKDGKKKKNPMSSFFDLFSVGKAYSNDCFNFDNNYVSGFFLVFDFWPIYVAFILLAIKINRAEIFADVVLAGGSLDLVINWVFRDYVFSQNGPEYVCSSSYQMPAYASSALCFLFTTLIISSGFIYKVKLSFVNSFMLFVGIPVALYARVWLRFNTGPQLLVGALFGIIEGVVYCFFMKFVFTYKFLRKWMLESKGGIMGFLFGSCQDTLLRPKHPYIFLDKPPSKIHLKVSGKDDIQKLKEVSEDGGYN